MNNCQCTIDVEMNSEERPEAYKAILRRARKTHICYECDREIEPREQYEVVSGIWDGRPNRYKTCEDCLSVRKTFCTSWMFGDLWERMAELACDLRGDISSCRIIELTPTARNKVCDLFEEYLKS